MGQMMKCQNDEKCSGTCCNGEHKGLHERNILCDRNCDLLDEPCREATKEEIDEEENTWWSNRKGGNLLEN